MDADKLIDALLEAETRGQREREIVAGVHHLKRWTEKRCGNCYYWMKSSLCPAERNVNGYSRGPNMNDRRAASCGSFVVCPLNTKSSEKERAELTQKAAEYGLSDLLRAAQREESE